MWLNSDPFSTWREAGWRQGTLIKAKKGKKKKAEEEEEDAGGAPCAAARCPMLGAVTSSGPGPAAPTLPPRHGKEEIPWDWGKRQEKSMSQTK